LFGKSSLKRGRGVFALRLRRSSLESFLAKNSSSHGKIRYLGSYADFLDSGSELTIAGSTTKPEKTRLTGFGALHGEPWNWDYIRFSMRLQGVMNYEVSQLLLKDNLIERQQIFAGPFPVAIPIRPDEYQRRFKAMKCLDGAGNWDVSGAIE
jgi:hypothetical protein